jgi:hypothetical protein
MNVGTEVGCCNGANLAVKAMYIDQKISEYNQNPLIQALPPTFDNEDFIELVADNPKYSIQETHLIGPERFHCIARLSSYFDPQSKTINLNNDISILIKRGYLARNPFKPVFALRSQQIYEAIQNSSGKNLERYIIQPTSASGLTLIGPSGMGKTTNLHRILNLYPQVIFHPELSTYQIVWLKIDCPHAGSLKGLCIDIFLAIDRLLGTNYCNKFGSRSNTEDLMLAQVAQLAHTHHLGVLVIDEMQNLVTAHRGKDDLLNFLVKMDNIIGVPVIKIGTNEALPILQGNFRNARRGTGEGSIIWDRMQNDDDDWKYFVGNLWEFQWTKNIVMLSPELEEVFYDETQGIIDVAIKLFRMVQYRSIALNGDEKITVDLIKKVAKDGLFLLKPMLDALRNNDEREMLLYKDIMPILDKSISVYEQKQLSILNQAILQKNRQKQKNINSSIVNAVILKLMDLEVSPDGAKKYAEHIANNNEGNLSIDDLVKRAYILYLQGTLDANSSVAKLNSQLVKKKLKIAYGKDDLRQIIEKSTKHNTDAYEDIKAVGLIADLMTEYIN